MSMFVPYLRYWPAEVGPFWWSHFQQDSVRRDFDRLAEAGIGHLRLVLGWDEFQPSGPRVSASAMRNVEYVLQLADDRALLLTLTLFATRVAGVLMIPQLALSDGQLRSDAVLCGQTESRRPLRNLFSDSRVCEAQTVLIREIMGEFWSHPAISGWVLGDGLSAATVPADDEAFERWLLSVAEVASASGNRKPVGHALSARDVIRESRIDLSALGRAGIDPWITLDWRPAWTGDDIAVWWSFLVAYVGHFSGTSPVLSAVGIESNTFDTLDVLAIARSAGAAGYEAGLAFGWGRDVLRVPQLRRAEPLSAVGLLDRGETARLADLPGAFALALQQRTPVPPLAGPGQQERRGDPEGVARDCFAAFVS